MKAKIQEAIIPAFITLIVFLGVLAVKGIFPFGTARIDYYDMGQTNVPLYYHIWDFLHGRSGLFYTWYINQGQNLSMGSSIQWNISIFNLFFLLVPRHRVIQSLSLFMGIHLFFMSMNMNLLLQRVVPGNTDRESTRFCRLMMSVAYGLCGYTLTHYTIPTYLDTAALMPLYLITLLDVLEVKSDAGDTATSAAPCSWRRNVLPYALATGYMTALSYYLSLMNLIFILVISGTYVFMLYPKKTDIFPAALRLGLGTFSGLGLSAFMLFPAAMQMSHSSRFQSNLEHTPLDTIKDILWAIGAEMYYIKWWSLAGSLAACAAIVVGLIKFREEKRRNLFWLLICFYPCALIPFESINLIVHMGTYYHYPIRCGYWIPITLLTAGTYYMSRLTEHSTRSRLKPVALVIFAVASFASGLAFITYYNRHSLWEVKDLFNCWIVLASVLFLIYVSALLISNDIRFISCTLALELICGAYIGYGMPHFTDSHASGPEQDGDYVITAMQLEDELNIAESRTDRIKNPDTSLNTNYGMIMNRATVGGWANTLPRPQMDHAGSLGYTLHFMRIMDSGGTVFSDALLHTTQTLTYEPFYCDNAAYHLNDSNGNYYLYDNLYTLPFAIPISSDLTYKNADYDVAKTQNRYYHALSGLSSDILIDVGDPTTHPIKIRGRRALYFGGGSAEQITVNGRAIPIPSLGHPESTSYPSEFNGALIFAGLYENETVLVQGLTGGRAYLLDLDAMDDLNERYNDIDQTVSTSNSGLNIEIDCLSDTHMVLLPISYDPGFRAKVNGTTQTIRNIDDILIGIPVGPGHNSIDIQFKPSGMIPGIIVSLVTLSLIVALSLPRFSLTSPIVINLSRVALFVLWMSVILIVYIIPILAFIIHQVQKRL